MTAVVVGLTITVAVLTFLVAGLLRSHADILRRLHALDAGEGGGDLPADDDGGTGPQSSSISRPADDITGTSPAGDPVAVRVAGVEHDTVLLFLSTGCSGCGRLWDDIAPPGRPRLPDGVRLVVVTESLQHEDPGRLQEVAPAHHVVVASSSAWRDYEVPGSPYLVLVRGGEGRVAGEGTAASWDRLAERLAAMTGEAGYLDRRAPGRARADAEREADTDAALLAAGIEPGDPRLHGGDR